MYHSITFGNKNTWEDWHLVPSSRPVVNPPKPKTQYVDIPGADGSIDLTESLAGRPVFSDREGSFDFIVLNDFNIDNYDYNWVDVYTSIMQYLHGRHMTMILEDDPNYYYEGRFTVNNWKSDANNSTITIDYVLSPYKYSVTGKITSADLEIGSLGTNDSSGSLVIVELDSTNAARTKVVRPYSAGDSIRVGNRYLFDLALYGGTAEAPVAKDFIWAGYMNGNRYEFTDSGFYRLNIKKPNYYVESITADDLEPMAEAIQYYTGGVL